MALSPITAKASLDPSGFTAGVQEIKKRLSELNAAYETNKAEMKQLGTEMNKLEREKRKLTEQMKNGGTDEQKKQLEALNDKIAQVATKLGTMRTKEAELKTELKAATQELESEKKTAKELADSFDTLGTALENSKGSAQDFGGVFEALGLAATVKEIAAAFRECVQAAEDFEATMSTVESLSGATASEMDNLSAKAKELGATTKFTATESAQAMTYMGMAGWDAAQMLSGMDGVLNLAAASGTDLATTADIVTDALTAFGLKAEDTARFADVLAAAATNSNTSVEIMGETFKNSASVAGALGYSIEDVSTAVGLMANAGVKGSIAGTSLKHTFEGLLKGVTLTSNAFGEVEVSAVKADGTMKSFGESVDELRGYFMQMSDAEKMMNAIEVAGKYGFNGLLAILNSTQEDYDKLAESINNCEGAAEHMADVRMDNLQGQVTLLNSATDALKTTIGESFQGELRGLAELGTNILTVINGVLSKSPALTKGVVTLTAEVVALMSALAASKTIASVSTAMQGLGLSLNFAAGAQTALNVAMNAAPYVMLATALTTGLVAVMDSLASRTEEAQKHIAELADEVHNLATESEKVVEEQKQLERVIEEYERISSTVSDTKDKKEELARLQETLNELYEDEKIKIDLVNGSYDEQIAKLQQLSDIERDYRIAEISQAIDDANKAINEAEAHQIPITFDWSGANEDFENELNELYKTWQNIDEEAGRAFSTFTLSGGRDNERNFLVEGDIETQIRALTDLQTVMRETGAITGEYAATYQQISDKIDQLNGLLSDKDGLVSQMDELNGTIDETNTTSGYAIDTFKELADAYKAASPEELSKQTEELTKSASGLISEYSSLYDTLDKLKKGESLNYEQMQALIAIYPDLAKYVQVTADGYSIEIDALDDLNNALDDNLQKRIEHEKQATYETLRGWQERKKIIEREIATSAQAAAHDPMARAAYDAAMSNLKEANGEIADLYAKLDTWETAPAYMASGRGKSSKSSSGSSGGSGKETKVKVPDLGNIIGYFKKASAAFKEFNENKKLSDDAVQSLIAAGYKEALVYHEATDTWTLDANKFEEVAKKQISAAKEVDGVTDTEKQALDSLSKKLSEVEAGTYGVAKANEELEDKLKSVGDTASSMKTLSAAIVEQNTDNGLSPDTISKLSGTRYAEALTVGVDAQITLDTSKLETILSDEIEDAIKQLESELATATDPDKIGGLKAQIQAFKNLKAVIGEVTAGLYGVEKAEEKLISDAALKASEDMANRRLKQIDAELKAKQKLRDETLKAIDDEVQARKRLTEDNDIQRQIDQAMAQLKYSQLDEFSQAQLQRKIQSLQNDKADMLWERGIEDRRAAANEEYNTSAEQLNNEKENINNALEVLRSLNDTVDTGLTDLGETIKAAMEAVKPDSTVNLTMNNVDKMTADQLLKMITDLFGSTGAV